MLVRLGAGGYANPVQGTVVSNKFTPVWFKPEAATRAKALAEAWANQHGYEVVDMEGCFRIRLKTTRQAFRAEVQRMTQLLEELNQRWRREGVYSEKVPP